MQVMLNFQHFRAAVGQLSWCYGGGEAVARAGRGFTPLEPVLADSGRI